MEPNQSLAQGMHNSITPQEEKLEGTYLPRILDMKVIYGLGDGQGDERKPDPNKILFYHDTVGNRFYDCGKQEWCPEKPSVIDHLPSRPLLHNDQDVVQAIAHGVMDDADYDALDKSGMMGELPKKLWGNIKHLKKLHEDLEKEQLAKADEEGMTDPDLKPEGHAEVNHDDDYLNENDDDNDRLPGEDVVSEIVRLAMADSDDHIRQIVREELMKLTGIGSEPEDDDEFMEDEEPEIESNNKEEPEEVIEE